MGKPFQPVERLPVPPEVDASFRKLSAAQQGTGRARSAGGGYAKSEAQRAAADRAAGKLAEAEAEAASHFGGDAAKAATHHGRWTRWGKTAMSAPALAEDLALRTAERLAPKAREQMEDRGVDKIGRKSPATARAMRLTIADRRKGA